MKLKLSLMLALVLLLLCSTSVFAIVPPFSMTVGPGAAPDTWAYTLYNDDTTGYVIPMYLDIVWNPAVPTSYYTVSGTPAGWVVNPGYDWPAWDAIGIDPESGESLTGFELTAPTFAPDFVAYYNVLGEERSYEGNVTLVPEPSSMLALLGGLGSLGAMIRRRRA